MTNQKHGKLPAKLAEENPWDTLQFWVSAATVGLWDTRWQPRWNPRGRRNGVVTWFFAWNALKFAKKKWGMLLGPKEPGGPKN